MRLLFQQVNVIIDGCLATPDLRWLYSVLSSGTFFFFIASLSIHNQARIIKLDSRSSCDRASVSVYGEWKRLQTVHCLHELRHAAILHRLFVGVHLSWKKVFSSVSALLWYPLCHIQLLKLVMMLQCKVLLSVSYQILWRPQVLLLLTQLPWIPLLRHLIGGNNKPSSFKALTNLSPIWWSERLSRMLTLTYLHPHTCE